MRSVYILAAIGAAVILGVKYIAPETEVLSLISGVVGLMTVFLAAGAKVSADEAAKKAELSVQRSTENQVLIKETKDSVNGQLHEHLAVTKQLGEEIGKALGKQEGKAQEQADQAIRDEKAE